MEDIYIYELKCPHCGSICEDYQKDSKEENKEEYCGECDNQFGYYERFEYEDDLSGDNWMLEDIPQTEIRMYYSFEL